MASTKKTRPTIHSSHRATTERDAPKKRATAPKKSTAAKRPAAKPLRPTPRTETRPSPVVAAARKDRPKREVSSSSPSTATDSARQTAIEISTAALEKKAVGVEIVDVSGRVDYADFVVLMTGRSDRQVAALAQAIEQDMKQRGKRPTSVEGMPHASWVLIDFGDVVVHVFQEEVRSLYDIEGLWADAKRLPLPID